MESDTSDKTLQYQLTREEMVEQLWKLIFRPWLIVSMASIFLCGIGMLALRPAQPLVGRGMIIFPIVFMLLSRWWIRRIVAQHPEFLEMQTMSFDDSGLSVANSVTRVQWPWNRIRGVIDSKEFYIFRFDTLGSGAIIPKRALRAQQSEQLLAYARSNAA